MKVVVLGYGSMGKRRAEHAREYGCEVGVKEAIHARVAQARADGFKVDGLSRWDPEAVIISTPAHGHGPLFWRYERDAPPERMLIEKPLGLSVDDFLQGHTATGFRRAQRRSRVGYSFRFHPGVRVLQSGLATLAPIQRADLWILCDGSSWPGQNYSDTLLECSHELDLALFLFGPAKVVAADWAPDRETWALTLQHTSGTQTGILLSTGFAYYTRGIKAQGLHGTWVYSWNAPIGATTIRDATRAAIWRAHVTPDDCYRAEMAAFLAGGEHGATLVDGLAVLALCDQARALVGPRSAGTNAKARNSGPVVKAD